jgi:hypothetical protein
MSPVSVQPLHPLKTLDLQEGWELAPDSLEKFSTEIAALEALAGGLNTLHWWVRDWETSHFPPHFSAFVMSQLRSAIGFVGTGECFMQWYAISSTNFAGLVAHIAAELGFLKGHEQRALYRRTVCGPLLDYRNKVAAHFARWHPHRDDSETVRRSSVFPQLCILGGRLAVGGSAFVEVSSGVTTVQKPVAQWALTRAHENLAARYPYLLMTPPAPPPDRPPEKTAVRMGG